MESVDLHVQTTLPAVERAVERIKEICGADGKVNELSDFIADEATIVSPFFNNASTQKGKSAVLTELMFVAEHMKMYPVETKCVLKPYEYEIEYRDWMKLHRIYITFRFDEKGMIRHVQSSDKQFVSLWGCFLKAAACGFY